MWLTSYFYGTELRQMAFIYFSILFLYTRNMQNFGALCHSFLEWPFQSLEATPENNMGVCRGDGQQTSLHIFIMSFRSLKLWRSHAHSLFSTIIFIPNASHSCQHMGAVDKIWYRSYIWIHRQRKVKIFNMLPKYDIVYIY